VSVGDWRPAASLATLHARAQLLQCVRRFFIERGYWEVETPLLSRDTCVDSWIDPVPVPDPTRPDGTLYLQTSPEFAMKRLLAAGAEAIFQITRSFRRGESGRRHNLEFTIVEWYRTGRTHHDEMRLVEDLVRTAAAHPLAALSVGAAPGAAPTLPPDAFPRFTYDEAARGALGESVLDKSPAELKALARKAGVSPPVSLDLGDHDGWLNLLLAERIEPWLARHPACFLHDYPATQAALARVRPGSPAVAERFELYLHGVEICNGYHELTDAEELSRRMERHNEVRVAAGGRPLPTESRLLDAMRAGLPPCAGTALGFDRLAMWRLGLEDLREALAFPWERA
jgi:lysyl-tRNA synthetase class 2